MNIIDKVREVVAQKLGLEENSIDESSQFIKLGVDSLDMAEIASELEEHYKIDLVFEDLECKTINDMASVVQEAINDNS